MEEQDASNSNAEVLDSVTSYRHDRRLLRMFTTSGGSRE